MLILCWSTSCALVCCFDIYSLLFSVRFLCFFFFKQKTAYEMRISDWSSDVCSSDLNGDAPLLDLNEASVKKLISRAKKRGYITYEELNNALPQGQLSSQPIEDVMAAHKDMGVHIVENEGAREAGDDSPEDEVEDVTQADEEGDGDGDARHSVT